MTRQNKGASSTAKGTTVATCGTCGVTFQGTLNKVRATLALHNRAKHPPGEQEQLPPEDAQRVLAETIARVAKQCLVPTMDPPQLKNKQYKVVRE